MIAVARRQMTEAELFHAYGEARRRERCACGGNLTATPGEVTEAVRGHQATLRHRRWWHDSGGAMGD